MYFAVLFRDVSELLPKSGAGIWQTLLALGFVFSLIRYGRGQRDGAPEGSKPPPGPPGLPLLGNLLAIPSKHSWLKFKEWCDIYGSIFKIRIMGSTHIIVSTEKVANDLLRERGNIYSDREQFPMAAKLISRDLQILLMPYNERWRRARKLVASFTLISVVSAYAPVQLEESTRMLYDLIREPSYYENWFERYAGSLIMRLAYGKSIKSKDDPILHAVVKVAHDVERAASPGAYLVDTVPLLMWLPTWLAPFKREANRLFNEHFALFHGLQNEVKEEIEAGTAASGTFMRTFLERQEEFKLCDDEGAYIIGTLFGAGTGTTAATMMSFCLAMCHHPKVYAELQQHIDDVVPTDRLPVLEDIPQLPMVRAVVKEVLRWRPVTAGGVPHKLTQTDVYHGMLIPAGANIHANQWAIHRDETLYPDPESFNPHRWLSPEYPTYREPLDKFPNLQAYSAFGFGRRICPGLNIAERSLNLLVARIAWACSLQAKPGIHLPLYDYTPGFNTQPNKFDFDLRARSEGRWRVVQHDFFALDDPARAGKEA